MEPKGVYRHTRTRAGAVAPVDYSELARGIEVSESHSAIAESQASNSSVEKEAFAYMTNSPEETTRRLEQQAHVEKEQFDMICAQQESIDTSSRCLHNCLRIRRSRRPKLLLRGLKASKKKGRVHFLCIYRRRNSPTPSRLSLHLKREAIQIMGALILKE